MLVINYTDTNQENLLQGLTIKFCLKFDKMTGVKQILHLQLIKSKCNIHY